LGEGRFRISAGIDARRRRIRGKVPDPLLPIWLFPLWPLIGVDHKVTVMSAQSQLAKIRLYVMHPLAQGQDITLTLEQAHYLFNVMRLPVGGKVALFNGTDGEWLGQIVVAGRKGGQVLCEAPVLPQRRPADIWLLFAPIKKARTDFIVEKAVELGVARLTPVQTEWTNSERIRQDRLQAHAIEAAEQCGATYVPKVDDLRPLARVLTEWDMSRALIWADEAQAGMARAPLPPAPAAILIGPEGGFSAAERNRLRSMACVTPLALGPRILRADTAAVAALTLWQAQCGDWA
jgi:16S rRNA (uracil1498-N3)-methyltransferase